MLCTAVYHIQHAVIHTGSQIPRGPAAALVSEVCTGALVQYPRRACIVHAQGGGPVLLLRYRLPDSCDGPAAAAHPDLTYVSMRGSVAGARGDGRRLRLRGNGDMSATKCRSRCRPGRLSGQATPVANGLST